MKRVVIIFLAVLMWCIGFMGMAGVFFEEGSVQLVAFVCSFFISWPAVWWWMDYFKKHLNK